MSTLGGGMFGKGGGGPLRERAASPPDGPKREDLRLHYEALIGLFKHYMELLFKFNIAFYAITGAILSYYLTHTEARVLRFALLLPVAFAFLFGLLFWIRDQLKLKSILEVRVLSGFLAVSGLCCFS